MYNILICDDQPDIVSALKIYLKPEGYGLYEAYNGQQALDILAEANIHLVLLDVMMPVMDGITAISRIREHSDVPIILLTAKSETEDKQVTWKTISTAKTPRLRSQRCATPTPLVWSLLFPA